MCTSDYKNDDMDLDQSSFELKPPIMYNENYVQYDLSVSFKQCDISSRYVQCNCTLSYMQYGSESKSVSLHDRLCDLNPKLDWNVKPTSKPKGILVFSFFLIK